MSEDEGEGSGGRKKGQGERGREDEAPRSTPSLRML